MSDQTLLNPGYLTNASQVVIRNSEWLHCDRMLMLGMPRDHLVQALLASHVTSDVYGLTQDYSVYRGIRSLWDDADRPLSFSPALPDDVGMFDGFLIFLQKSKPLMDFWLDMIQLLLHPNSVVWLVGENKEGIKSWRKRLKGRFIHVKNMDNARHCGLIEASQPSAVSEPFELNRYFTTCELPPETLPALDKTLLLTSLPGVFSHGRIDVGTRVLLETVNDVPAGSVLDFGCGAGVVGCYLATLQPEVTLTLVDCDAKALVSTQKTLLMNGIEGFQVVASDGLSDVTGCYRMIVSNPPFHQGVKTHYEVTEQFLAQSVNLLIPGGELRIVANSFLRYELIINKAFGNCRTMMVKNGFTVYQAFKPKLTNTQVIRREQ